MTHCDTLTEARRLAAEQAAAAEKAEMDALVAEAMAGIAPLDPSAQNREAYLKECARLAVKVGVWEGVIVQ
jgi:hypothetical protein